MKPATSPLLVAAIASACTLAAFATSALAQHSTTTTETTIEKKVTTEAPRPIEKDTVIEFQPASTAKDLDVQMLHDFESVKVGDPKVGAEIAKDPARVQDAAFVSKHPTLQAFLEKYPSARDEIVSSPGNFVTPVAGSKWNSHEAAGIPRN